MPRSDVGTAPRPNAGWSPLQHRPTLASGCARATTAAEARFRISYPFTSRASRVVAVDAASAPVVCRAGALDWSGLAHFLVYERPVAGEAAAGTPGDGGGRASGGNGSARGRGRVPGAGAELIPDAVLRACDGTEARLGDELDGADVTFMVATAKGAEAAAVVGRACHLRRISTAGVVLARPGEHVNDAVLALRPYAMVLAVLEDEQDLLDLLAALRV